MSKAGNAWRKVRGQITKSPSNFSWVLDGQLAGSGIPMSRAEFDWVLKQDVDSIITMTLDALPELWVQDAGDYLHVPTPDLDAPILEGIEHAVDFAHEKIAAGKRVMVHCAAGKGRAGTILACYLIKHKGLGAQEAIERIRNMRPGSIQSPAQEEIIEIYAKTIRG